MMEAPSRDQLEHLFKLFDKDTSNSISTEELMEVLTRGGSSLTLEDAAEIVDEFDVNGDGELSILEFVSAICAKSAAEEAARRALSADRTAALKALEEEKLKFAKVQTYRISDAIIQHAEKARVSQHAIDAARTAQRTADDAAHSVVTTDTSQGGSRTRKAATTFLKVKTLSGKMLKVNVDPKSDTVEDVMHGISDMEGISAKAVRLIWLGFIVTDLPRFAGTLESIRTFSLQDRRKKTNRGIKFGEKGDVMRMLIDLSKMK